MKTFTVSLLLLMSVPLVASADLVFSFAQDTRAASADFSSTAGQLTVTLTNISSFDVVQPDQLLTAVFFDLSGSHTLTPVSALLTPGSQVLFNGPQPAGGVVGGEWAFQQGLSGAPGAAAYGISATGLNLFGPHDLFPGDNLTGPNNVGGMDFGLLSAGNNPLVGNAAVTGQFALVDNSVTFTLAGLGADFDLSDISNVRFQYGTSLSEPSYGGITPPNEIPEPGTMVLLGAGLGFMMSKRVRRSRRM